MTIREKAPATGPRPVEWALLAAVLAFLFLAHIYNDVLATTRHAMHLWDYLGEGRALAFYDLNARSVPGNAFYMTPDSANYDFPLYIVFALWNLPMWALEKFLHVDVMNSIPCLLWMKGLVAVFFGSTALVFRRIVDALGIRADVRPWATFLYLSSAWAMTSVFVTAQYDVVGMLFVLLGVLAYLRGDRTRFLLWFAIAMPFKLFALLVFLPLLLLSEKRVWRIALQALAVAAPLVAFRLLFGLTSKYGSLPFQSFFLDFLTRNGIEISTGTVPLFPLAFLVLLLIAYATNPEDEGDRNRLAVRFSFLSLGSLFLLAYTQPYWIVLWVPFVLLTILLHPERWKANLAAETTMAFGMAYVQFFRFPQCFSARTLATMVLPKLLGIPAGAAAAQLDVALVRDLPLAEFLQGLALALFAAGALSLAILNRARTPEAGSDAAASRADPWPVRARFLIGAAVALVPTVLYVVSSTHRG